MEDGDIDVGNAQYGEQEAMIIIEDVFVPDELIFMDSEFESPPTRSTIRPIPPVPCLQNGPWRRDDGAAATVADYNGVLRTSVAGGDDASERDHRLSGVAASPELRAKSKIISATMLAMCASTTSQFPYELSPSLRISRVG